METNPVALQAYVASVKKNSISQFILGIRLVSYDAPNLLNSVVFPLKQLLIPLRNKNMWSQ